MVKIVAVISALAVVSAKDCDKAKAASRTYAQCGGYTYHGETCCPADRRCEFMSAEYSQCSGNFTGGAKAYEQCFGGPDYTGPTFCAKHLKCVKSGPYYGGCEPKKPKKAAWCRIRGNCKATILQSGFKTLSAAQAACLAPDSRCEGVYQYPDSDGFQLRTRACETWASEWKSCGRRRPQTRKPRASNVFDTRFCNMDQGGVTYFKPAPDVKCEAPLTATKGPTPTCDKAKAVSRKYAQCGGFTYHGETCCPKGRGCAFQSAEYFQCKECAKAYGQCAGGPGYNGSTCCSKGFQCKSSGAYYSGCVAKSQSKTVLV